MEEYDAAQICLNGHVITTKAKSSPNLKSDCCTDCGAETIMHCPKCKTEIKGDYICSNFNKQMGNLYYCAPHFCDSCGEPFPWFNSKLLNANAIIEDLGYLNLKQKAVFKNIISKLELESIKVAQTKSELRKHILTLDISDSVDISNILVGILSDELSDKLLNNSISNTLNNLILYHRSDRMGISK
jgi:hypothetical protein